MMLVDRLRFASVRGLVLVALTLLPRGASGQSTSLHPASNKSISLDVLHTFFKESDGLSASSFGAFLDGRFALGKPVLLVELPFAHAKDDFMSASGIGNIYVGAELPVSSMVVELGARLPTASSGGSDAGFIGTFADIDRFESFIDDALTLRAMLHYKRPTESVQIGLHGGLVHTRVSGDFDDTQTMVAYGIDADSRSATLAGGVGLFGRTIVSDAGGADLGERSVNVLNGWIEFGAGSFRPGVIAQLPLDSDLRDFMRASLGIRLQMLLH